LLRRQTGDVLPEGLNMITRWIRHALRSCGLALPFSGVICPEHVKTICIDPEGRAQVTVQQKLVFLTVPDRGDLCDTCTLDPATVYDTFRVQSTDSIEIRRQRLGRGIAAIYWQPRAPITRYAIYDHQYSWVLGGSYGEPAVCTEFQCDTKTGIFTFEMLTPQGFDAALVFERPRWPILNTERKLVKYALKQIEAGGDRPSIVDNGQRIEWKIREPKKARYICVAFHHHGMLLWKERLEKTSIGGRVRQLFGRGRVVAG
jgi:hypothetical protein